MIDRVGVLSTHHRLPRLSAPRFAAEKPSETIDLVVQVPRYLHQMLKEREILLGESSDTRAVSKAMALIRVVTKAREGSRYKVRLAYAKETRAGGFMRGTRYSAHFIPLPVRVDLGDDPVSYKYRLDQESMASMQKLAQVHGCEPEDLFRAAMLLFYNARNIKKNAPSHDLALFKMAGDDKVVSVSWLKDAL